MAPRSLAVGTLGALLIVAGCSGFVPGEQAAGDTPTATATPAPVPTDSATPRPGIGAVPGLSPRGVEDSFDLARAHDAVLANVTHTRRVDEVTLFPNGSLRSRRVAVVWVEPGSLADRYYRVETVYGPVSPTDVPYPGAERVETYAAEQLHVAVTYPNGTTRYNSSRRTDFDRRTLALLLSAFETRVTGRTTCANTTCYRVRSTALASPGFLAAAFLGPSDRGVSNASLIALVDQRGLVREYELRYDVETASGTYTAIRQVTYAGLRETTVERPSWIENTTGIPD